MSQDNQKEMSDEVRNILLTVSIISFCVLALFMINIFTVEQAEVSAPCVLIKSDAPLPENIITKGYTVFRNATGDYIPALDSCWYVKDAGLIERLVYNWDLHN